MSPETGNPNLMLPGNPRYQPKDLQLVFGYDNLYRAVGEVELATLRALGQFGIIPHADLELLTDEIAKEVLAITTTEVDRVEREVTKHDLRAWVRLAQAILPLPLRRWVHVPLTSYDALDTARALQFSRAHLVLRPKISQVIEILAGLVRHYADTLMIGRTHGQHALPITVGFWLAKILHRLLDNAEELQRAADRLVGKISGAVGARNAQVGLQIVGTDRFRRDGGSFQREVLQQLNLPPARISTQIVPPEPLARYLFACCELSATFGQLGRDCRHLMRTEIAEVAEVFEPGQVGSSTMPHKRNPITFEQLEGMWLRTKAEFGKVLDTLISEHQRDLVGSSVARDYPIIVINLCAQLDALLRPNQQGRPFLARLTVDPAACQRNFERSAHLILAEPMYLALQMAGYPGDAHELINRAAVPMAQADGRPLIAAVTCLAETDGELAQAVSRIPPPVAQLLAMPERYRGDASEQALQIAAAAEAYARS